MCGNYCHCALCAVYRSPQQPEHLNAAAYRRIISATNGEKQKRKKQYYHFVRIEILMSSVRRRTGISNANECVCVCVPLHYLVYATCIDTSHDNLIEFFSLTPSIHVHINFFYYYDHPRFVRDSHFIPLSSQVDSRISRNGQLVRQSLFRIAYDDDVSSMWLVDFVNHFPN